MDFEEYKEKRVEYVGSTFHAGKEYSVHYLNNGKIGVNSYRQTNFSGGGTPLRSVSVYDSVDDIDLWRIKELIRRYEEQDFPERVNKKRKFSVSRKEVK